MQTLYRPQDLGWKQRHIVGALGLRPPIAQHTEAEAETLKRYATGARVAVEIGVAEGGSAAELRSVIDPVGTLYLIDPFFTNGRVPSLAQIVAHRAVARVDRGRVFWMRKTSQEAVVGWAEPIDFLFIDGDHSYEGVRADWQTWTPHVKPEGVVAMHDAMSNETVGDAGPMRVREEAERSGWRLVESVDQVAVLCRR